MSESLADRLSALDSAVAEASERREKAWRRRQNEFEVSVDATAPLTAYRDAVSQTVSYWKRQAGDRACSSSATPPSCRSLKLRGKSYMT